MGFEPLVDKWTAFGWHASTAMTCRPLSPPSIPRALKEDKPRVILVDTLMGKGVPFLETRDKNHFIRVHPPAWQQATAHVDSTQTEGAL